jgi:23S rRNA (cytidine1920-2'-O)/16S rRNA (cytidine1409-2'-O)-methyltransferase
MERTNARKPFALPEQVDLIVADVSFISLLAVLPPSLRHLRPGGEIVALFKPQFEAAKGEVGRGGVIDGEGLLEELVSRFRRGAAEQALEVRDVIESPIRGDKGNREFLVRIVPVGTG